MLVLKTTGTHEQKAKATGLIENNTQGIWVNFTY